jgi:hypothetical protein
VTKDPRNPSKCTNMEIAREGAGIPRSYRRDLGASSRPQAGQDHPGGATRRDRREALLRASGEEVAGLRRIVHTGGTPLYLPLRGARIRSKGLRGGFWFRV